MAPHEDSVSAVDEWLAEYGFASHEVSRSPAGDWVNIRLPVSLANEMLKTVRSLAWYTPDLANCCLSVSRNITSGSMRRQAMPSSARHRTAFPSTCMCTLTSSSPRLHLLA